MGEKRKEPKESKPILLKDKNGVVASVHEAAGVLGMTPGTLARMAVDLGMKTPEMTNLIKQVKQQIA